MLKKVFSFIFFINFFLCSIILAEQDPNISLEDDAREKQLGFEHKYRDSENVLNQKLIRYIELNQLDKIKNHIKENGKNLNFQVKGINPFVHAATMNNIYVVKFFLNEAEIDLDYEDTLGNTALLKSSEKGHLEITEFLINSGSNINHQNKQGMTAAMKAAENDHYYILKMLMEYNIDKTRSDYSGRTLQEIAENSRDKRLLKLFN